MNRDFGNNFLNHYFSYNFLKKTIFEKKQILMRFIFIILFLFSLQSYCQIDSLHYKESQKENRFKVAGRVLKNSIITVPGDLSEMGHSLSKDWKTTAIYSASILGLIAVDEYTTTFLQDYIETGIDYTIPDIDPFKENKYPWISGEDAYISYPLIGLYLGSFIANNEKGQRVAGNAFKSMAYSFVISHILLKSIIARKRPHPKLSSNTPAEYPYTTNHWDFGYYHSPTAGSQQYGTAMPSLHATAYYAVAKVIQMEYDNYWIPYTFVSAVFMANFYGHKHWVSDMLVGGLVGTIIGRSVVLSSRKQVAKDEQKLAVKNANKTQFTKQLIPQISSSMVGFQFVASF